MDFTAPQHDQDRDRDQQPDDRVGQREPEQHADRAKDDRQRGEAVQPGVDPVGDECGRADLLADPDAADRDHFVAEEADDAGSDQQPRVVDGARVDEPIDGLPTGDNRR